MKPYYILHHHKLKRTSCREGIIKVIMNAGHALSEEEINKRLEGNYDRSTFYRSFKTLEEHHILHKIVVDHQLVKYALDNSVTSKEKHAHFFCTDCNTVRCLDDIQIVEPTLPKGYTSFECEIIIKGRCNQCNKKNLEATAV